MINTISNSQNCPCGSGKTYLNCCKPYLEQTKHAPTAEALMRSRYTAFTQKDVAYLRYSWHPDTCPEQIHTNEHTRWLGLKIIQTVAGQISDLEGTVEYVARSKMNGKAHRLHENSRFKRISDHWVYVDGDYPNK